MAKVSISDVLSKLSDDELKIVVEEARKKRTRSRIDSLVFDDGGDSGDDDDDDKGGKGKGGGWFGQ